VPLSQIAILVWSGLVWRVYGWVGLSFTRLWWNNYTRTSGRAMLIRLLFGILDGIKASAFGDMLPAWRQRLPLAEQGRAWLRPRLVTVIRAVSGGRDGGRTMISDVH
uniref:branched-chain amino acid transport system II carrier protein n=1 Tax=Salmonella enterica TaxID=28901 RepID=UPI00398C7946